ncbi:MAG: twin transmembrane helix small protein [Gallionellaceae bacterium]|nr:twin transmembrane helix small protein [Gallionellaceae bacterium]
MKILVLLIVMLILASLGQALYFLIRDRGQGERAVRALTWRIGLSLGLFLLLMAGFHFGFIPVRGS